MDHILEYEAFNEKKQAGVIYHYTKPKYLLKILEEDRMTSGHQFISFSRNANLKEWGDWYGANCRITFNGSNLTDKFKMEPYLFDPAKDVLFGGGPAVSAEERRKRYGIEREERIHREEITGVKKYIVQVDVLNPSDDDKEKINKAISENPDIKIQIVDAFRPVKGIIV